jgi:spore coat polysaccharide biosynthesis protein SpsF (cytidylyltransferase family)
MTLEEQEHVTLYCYHHPEHFKIKSLVTTNPVLAKRRLVVDTMDDLQHIENILSNQDEQTRGYAGYLEIETE